MRHERLASFAVVLVVMVICMLAVRSVAVQPVADSPPSFAVVTAVVGSENQPFFSDQRVKDAFARHGLQLRVDAEGSRQMATADNTCHYDLAFPSSQPAADKIKEKCPVLRRYLAFSSPMVVVTFGDIVPLLQQEGIATQDATTKIWTFNVEKYLNVAINELQWNQIPNNRTHAARNNVLLTTTDPQDSNSAAMYVGMTSYVLNNYRVVKDQQKVRDLAQIIGQKLFANQGLTQPTSQLPFEDYLGSLGESLAPMVLLYEAQFVDVALNHPNLITDKRLVVMYPNPTTEASHTVVPMTSLGDRVGKLLNGDDYDPKIIQMEAEHGFRTHDPQNTFTMIMKMHGITVPSQLDVAPLPTYENLEGLLNEIQRIYHGH